MRVVTSLVPSSQDSMDLANRFRIVPAAPKPTPQERWGAITSFIQDLWPLLPALIQHWDPQKYVKGTARDPDGGNKFNPVALQKTLQDPVFVFYVDMVLAIYNSMGSLASGLEGMLVPRAPPTLALPPQGDDFACERAGGR